MDDYLQKYIEMFGDGFPMIPLGMSRTEDEVVEIIKECLEKGKDVYELGYVEDDDEIMY